jgi:hypothetical protein
MTVSRRVAWTTLLTLVVLSAGVVLVPVFLIRPFAPQTGGTLALSFLLRRWSPLFTVLAAAGALWLAWRLWRASPRVLPRAAVALVTLLIMGGAWLARQNHFEWMFAPLPNAGFVRAAEAGFVAPDDMVLAVAVAGDAAAYPVRQLAYHHLVQDAVGKVPIVATY